jgi:hypothetical protein
VLGFCLGCARSFTRNIRPLFLFITCCFAAGVAFAGTPSSGSVNPQKGATVKWSGSGVGGTTTDETTCVDAVDCDVFTITLNGSPSDYKGLVLLVSISHQVSLNDYDLFVHQGGLNGPVVASSTNGIPETGESVVINPAITGTGIYTIHIVDSLVAPGDPYSGAALVTSPPAG